MILAGPPRTATVSLDRLEQLADTHDVGLTRNGNTYAVVIDGRVYEAREES